MPTNKFCKSDDLKNEAAVEQFFISRLLIDLDYQDSQIKPKTSLQQLVVSLGSRRLKYKPDYALQVDRKIRWILDAKSPNEDLLNFEKLMSHLVAQEHWTLPGTRFQREESLGFSLRLMGVKGS